MSKNNSARVSSVSYEKIALAASDVEITPEVYANMTGTADKAPMLMRVTPAAQIRLDDFCQLVAAVTGHPFEETRREDAIRMEVIAAAFAEGYTYVDTGYVTYDLRIAGSITSVTEETNATKNPIYIGAYPSRELANAVAQITAKLDKSGDPFEIKTVFTKNSHDRFIKSNLEFQANGTGLKMGAAGAKVELKFPDGTVKAAPVTDHGPLHVCATAPQGTDAKTCTVAITSGNGEGGLVTLEKENVPFKYVPPAATITLVKQEGRADNTVQLSTESLFTVIGTVLTLGSADKVLIELYDANGTLIDEGDCTSKVTANTDTSITLSGLLWNARRPDGDWYNAYPRSKLVIVKNGARTEYAVTFCG